jgi:hypothetical protein
MVEREVRDDTGRTMIRGRTRERMGCTAQHSAEQDSHARMHARTQVQHAPSMRSRILSSSSGDRSTSRQPLTNSSAVTSESSSNLLLCERLLNTILSRDALRVLLTGDMSSSSTAPLFFLPRLLKCMLSRARLARISSAVIVVLLFALSLSGEGA